MRIACSIAILFSSACSTGGVGDTGDAGDTGNTGSGEVSYDTFNTDFVNAMCERVVRCCADGELTNFPTDLSGCIETGIRNIRDPYGAYTRTLDDGAGEWNPAAAARCVDAASATDCAAAPAYLIPPNLTACDDVITPLVPLGEDCGGLYNSFECIGDEVWCPGILSGTCQDQPDIGETCQPGWCRGSLYCDPSSDACVDPVALGEDCTGGVCGAGTYCSATSSTCVPQLEGGETCDSGAQCLTGACSPNGCTAVVNPSCHG